MKKLFVWAMVATLLMAGSAFAGLNAKVAPNATAGAAFFTGTGPTTTNNDDSCDISTAPAATLLLPYFEVDINAPQTTAQTTLFTITNVTQIPQIAHVTVWTDLSFPVLDFNIFLTGYDVQGINLYDVIARGFVASTAGTSIDDSISPTGQRSLDNDQNPNFGPNVESDCSILPGPIPPNILADVRTALTTGRVTGCGSAAVGLVHTNAIGYVTIDVAATCSVALPIESTYYSSELLFDNTLIGDYQQINPNPTTGNYAGGNPLVHIRAVPEGGGAGSRVSTALPYTFYDRYTPAADRAIDRRQPLPSAFAARFIQGGRDAFATNFVIWREGLTGTNASCASNIINSAIPIVEIIRFDEHENPFVIQYCPFEGCYNPPTLPATSSTGTDNRSSTYPSMGTPDIGGWMYLNLNDGGSPRYSVTSHAGGTITTGPAVTPFGSPRASQNWVDVTMFTNAGVITWELDAAPLGNGCSPAATVDPFLIATPPAPAGGVFVCPPGTTLTNGTTALCTGTNRNPNP